MTPEERTNQRYRDAITYAQSTCTTHDHEPPVSNYRCCTDEQRD